MSSALAADAARRCPACGHAAVGETCARCAGAARDLTHDAPPLRPGARAWPLDLAHGFAAPFRAAVQLLHHRAFVGQLRLPLAANVLAFAGLFAVALAVRGWFAALFATEWPLLDDWRRERAGDAPVLLTVATAWMLGPALLEAATGPFVERLVDATERAMAGPGMQVPHERPWPVAIARMRQGARAFAGQLLLLPAAWLLALVPGAGIPLVLLLAGAGAAVVFFEAPAARRGLDLRQRLGVLRANWARALGFGMALCLLALVPLFDLLLLAPAAGVASARLWFSFAKAGA